jgi:hypothetical protein
MWLLFDLWIDCHAKQEASCSMKLEVLILFSSASPHVIRDASIDGCSSTPIVFRRNMCSTRRVSTENVEDDEIDGTWNK